MPKICQALDNERAIFFCNCATSNHYFWQNQPCRIDFDYGALLQPKKRAHATLFGGEACSSAHCSACSRACSNTMGARDSSELFSLAMQFVASLAWAVAALLEGLSSHIDALYFIAAVAWLLSCFATAHAMGLLTQSSKEAPSLPGTDEAKDNNV